MLPVISIPGLRFHRVETDSGLPGIRRGDYVLIVPVHRYEHEGEYLFACGNIYLCQHVGRGNFRCKGRCPETVSAEEFDSEVTGKIVGILKVTHPSALAVGGEQ